MWPTFVAKNCVLKVRTGSETVEEHQLVRVIFTVGILLDIRVFGLLRTYNLSLVQGWTGR